MKKICIITAARSEYGYLKWLMKDVENDKDLLLQTIVTGGHLAKDQGYTINQIKEDNIPITEVLDVNVDNTSDLAICKTMSRMADGISDIFEKLKPDCIVVLGDRYELLPICSTAFMMRIPIVHLDGGDVTEGALDDNIRNAVSMLASYHFPATETACKNIARMRNSADNIFVVGEPSLDLFNRISLLTRDQLADNLGIDIHKKWALCTLHSETTKSLEYNMDMASNLFNVLKECSDYEIIITKANKDAGGNEINDFFEKSIKSFKHIKLVASLGQLRYLSFMKQVDFVIGNSSSGISETPYLNIPTINIGERQKGRYLCENIIQTGVTYNEIKNAVGDIHKKDIKDQFYHGDGHSTEKILSKLKELL